jgi:hypothetical protein
LSRAEGITVCPYSLIIVDNLNYFQLSEGNPFVIELGWSKLSGGKTSEGQTIDCQRCSNFDFKTDLKRIDSTDCDSALASLRNFSRKTA